MFFLSIWCSHEDSCHCVEKAIQKLLNHSKPFSQTYYVCSQHQFSCVDMENNLGFIPQTNSEAALRAHQSKGNVGTVASFSVFKHTQSNSNEDGDKHKLSL